MDQAAEANRRVSEEMKRFRAALPGLLVGQHKGKWVVFKDGQVQSAHDSSGDAHEAGVKNFGPFGGQVIIQVVEEKPHYINAGAALFAQR